MASFDASGNAFNATNFYNSLLSAAKRGTLTADQVQAVWAAYSQVLPGGPPHLAEAPAVWQALADRIRDRKLSFDDALGQWRAFLATGATVQAQSSSAVAMPDAGAPVRALGFADPIRPPRPGRSPGPGIGPIVTIGDPNRTIAIGNFQMANPCFCCLVEKSLKLVPTPRLIRQMSQEAFKRWYGTVTLKVAEAKRANAPFPAVLDDRPTSFTSASFAGHFFVIAIEAKWYESVFQNPCRLEWHEWGNFDSLYSKAGKWVDIYGAALFEALLAEINGATPKPPDMFAEWFHDMTRGGKCLGTDPKHYEFRDNPGSPGGKGVVSIRNFLIRFHCARPDCDVLQPHCKTPQEIKLQQRLEFDGAGVLVENEKSTYLKEVKSFTDDKGKPVDDPKTFDPRELTKIPQPNYDKALDTWEELATNKQLPHG